MGTCVLGIDPGLRSANPAGYAVICFDPEPRLLAFGLLAPPDGAWHQRVMWLACEFDRLAGEHEIQGIAFETAHLDRAKGNVQTTIKLASVGAAALSVAALRDVPAVPVSPAEAKEALTGTGGAKKQQMMDAARLVFGKQLPSHAADAAGIAMAGEAQIRRQILVSRW